MRVLPNKNRHYLHQIDCPVGGTVGPAREGKVLGLVGERMSAKPNHSLIHMMNTSFELTVNGRARQVQVDPATPLLYVLRNDLEQKGTRFGCGTGACGACTVLVDGHALQSCDVTIEAVAGRTVLTTEGLADDPVGAMVRQAFIAEQAAQCGYCINGILLSVTALLTRDTTPGREQINEALNRHLCRCGTHVRILRAVHHAMALINTGGRP